jgi:hypothetical protein
MYRLLTARSVRRTRTGRRCRTPGALPRGCARPSLLCAYARERNRNFRTDYRRSVQAEAACTLRTMRRAACGTRASRAQETLLRHGRCDLHGLLRLRFHFWHYHRELEVQTQQALLMLGSDMSACS